MRSSGLFLSLNSFHRNTEYKLFILDNKYTFNKRTQIDSLFNFYIVTKTTLL